MEAALGSVGAAAWQQREATRPRARCSSNQQGVDKRSLSGVCGIKSVPSAPNRDQNHSLSGNSGTDSGPGSGMSERFWPDLPIGRIGLSAIDHNDMREIGRLGDRSRSPFSAPNVPLACPLAARMPTKCPRKWRVCAACRGSTPQRHAADHRCYASLRHTADFDDTRSCPRPRDAELFDTPS